MKGQHEFLMGLVNHLEQAGIPYWTKGRESEVQYADALGVAVVHYYDLDWDYLKKWAKELGVADALDRLRREATAAAELSHPSQ